MKTKMILFSLMASVMVLNGVAQGLKVGYTSADYILSLLPEAKQIEADLNSHRTMLDKQLQTKYADLQAKIEDYRSNAENFDDVVRADKEQEINNLQTNIQEFQQKAQDSMAKKRQELLEPAFEKIGKAIETVSEREGYDFIFDARSGGLDVLLYAKAEHDVSPLVLDELGVKAPVGE